jgi:hypothetical protein
VYCNGDPVNYFDNFGLSPKSALELISEKRDVINRVSEYYEVDPAGVASVIFQEKYHGIWAEAKNGLAYIAELKTSVRIDTIHTIDSIFIDTNNVTNINFKYTDEWVYVDGSNKFKDIKDSKTTINTININTPLKVGLTEDNQFFVTTPNPYVNISDIDGAKVLTKTTKPKRWGMGPTIAFGLGYGCGTDFNGGNVKGGFVLGGFIGWSVHYSVWQW